LKFGISLEFACPPSFWRGAWNLRFLNTSILQESNSQNFFFIGYNSEKLYQTGIWEMEYRLSIMPVFHMSKKVFVEMKK